MSFKRECNGSDSDLLKTLGSQRIKELLGIQIPEGEAKLLSNGRLTCMICINRPIFDTINVLSIHRKGKKHLLELGKYLQRKEELDLIKTKRQQKEYTKSLGVTVEHAGRGERKKMLDLPERDILDKSASSVESAIVSRYVASMTKKPSLKSVLNRAKKHPYQCLTSVSIASTSSSGLESNFIGPKNKPTEIGWIKNNDGSWSKDPSAEFDSDDD
ncbi:sodium channel modifier 1-like isoform X2 [Adelges cooleyi]|nr:sodium channel modifier 1-like isoform X2 [Adelges cooleyi]